MSQYYYFAATLPRLSLDEPAPMEVRRFLGECRRLLDPDDYRSVANAEVKALGEDFSGGAAARRYFATERVVRNALVEGRAQRLGWDAARYTRAERELPAEPVVGRNRVAQSVRAVLEAENPRKGEQLLLEHQWRIVDELESGHYFDVERLICYHLKLQLVARKDTFQRDTGREVFQRTMDAITEPLAEWRHSEDEEETE